MFLDNIFKKKTPAERIFICTDSFLQKDYDRGLKSLSLLGRTDETYFITDGKGKNIFLNAYLDLASSYLKKCPAEVSKIITDNYHWMNANKNNIDKKSYKNYKHGAIHESDIRQPFVRWLNDLINDNGRQECYTGKHAALDVVACESILSVSPYNIKPVNKAANQLLKNQFIQETIDVCDKVLMPDYQKRVDNCRAKKPNDKTFSRYDLYRETSKDIDEIAETFKEALTQAGTVCNDKKKQQLLKFAKERKAILDGTIGYGYGVVEKALWPTPKIVDEKQKLDIDKAVSQLKGLNF